MHPARERPGKRIEIPSLCVEYIDMKKPLMIGALLLFGAAVFLRLWLLGFSSFGADNMEFYKLALQDQDILEFWRNPPWLNQMPLNETFSLLLVKAGLPATPFVVRLPFALMGILALYFLWLFVRRHAGEAAAGATLLIAAFNPYQLYFSRTAYHYSGAITWSAALFCVFWLVKERLENNELPSRGLVVSWFAVAMLACHMHMSVWAVGALQGILLFGYGWKGLGGNTAPFRRFAIGLCVGGGASVLLLSRWIFRALQRLDIAAEGRRELIGEDAAVEFIRLLPAYFAGERPVGVGLLFGAVVLAVAALIIPSPKRRFYRSLTFVFLLHLVVFMAYIAVIGGGVAKIAYFSALWPLFILFLGIGTTLGIEAISGPRYTIRYGLGAILAAGYLAVTVPAAWAVVHLEGKPTPYFSINDWVLEHLPPGTPVLVDRWFEPWNEMALHNPGGIHYTFTVPDEPLDTYRRMNWRATVEDFFERYPRAAFVRVNPGKYERELGPWDFAERHFSQSSAVTNEAAVRMYRLGFVPTLDYARENRDRVVTRIYYNTTEDLIVRAQRQGQDRLRLYGEGWGYLKPWRPQPGWPEQLMQLTWIQAGAFLERGYGFTDLNGINRLPQPEAMRYLNRGQWADYRVPSQETAFRLFNLTEDTLTTELRIVAVALSGPVRVRAAHGTVSFPATLMVERRIPLSLEPGEQAVRFSVQPDQFLLVLSADLVETP